MEPASLAFYLSPETPSKDGLQTLKHFGFKNLSKAWKELAGLAQPPFDREAWEPLLPLMIREFAKSPDPGLALSQFSTFAEKAFHRTQLYEYLFRTPPARQALARVLGLSPYLASILCHEPGLFYWLFIDEGLYSKFNRDKLGDIFRLEMESATDLEGKLNALRRVKRRRMLRLGARDILGLSNVKDLTRELSDTADLILQKALDLGKEALGPRYPSPPPGSFTVMGMGKLGGRELNFYSDVDLLFVYEGTGAEARRYFNDLAEWVIAALPSQSPLGLLYKVDMRLRPEGLGDMAKSLDAYLEHYESRGQPWELQALLKARPCAGDLGLGEKFLKGVEPVIFRKNLDSVYLKEIREIMGLIKQKMESKGREKTHVKLGLGGIREIEFMIQFLQLVHGGVHPEVRNANSLQGLEALASGGFLLKPDAKTLEESYCFLRQLEHRLQMVEGLQTHTLPSKQADLERLARSLGFENEKGTSAVRSFHTAYREVTLKVHGLYQEIFKIRPRRDVVSKIVEGALENDQESLAETLQGGVFLDPVQAASNLTALVGRLRRSAGAKGETLWNQVGPDLLKSLAKVPYADRALNQMESFLRASSLPDVYLRYLGENPTLLKWMLELFSNSLFLSEILVTHPGNFDIVIRALGERTPQSVQDFLDVLEDRISQTPDREDRLNLLREVKDGEVLRVGLQDLMGRRELFDCFAELSRLATALSRSGLGIATERMDIPCVDNSPSTPKGFCLFGMGKLGGREMNYGSDLDLLFIYGDKEAKEVGFETYLKLSETFTQVMASSTNHGKAYKVDARLRPMGREAQMIHSVAAYRQYFQTFAQSAERLAYTRAVYLAGDRQTATEVKEMIDEFVYGRGLTRQEYDEILDIRQQMEEKAKMAQGLELKVSPGGIVDIEFFVQFLQVAFGKDKNILRVPHVPTALGIFKEEGIVPPEILDELLGAYRFYRLLEARHRMVRETGDDELPTDLERLKRLAWRAGLGKEKEAAEKMLERVEETQKRVRAIFNRLPEWLQLEKK